MIKDIKNLQEAKQQGICPYCGTKEPEIPGYGDAMKQFRDNTLSWRTRAEILANIPIAEWYEHNGTKYPYEANVQTMNDAYAHCHYGVNTWWNEIHYCEHCNKEYYTQHEH